MAAAWLRFRVELRARWGRTLVLAVVLGISAGAVLTLATGARRTASAYTRLLEATGAADVQVIVPGTDPDIDFEALATRPEVVDSAVGAAMLTALVDDAGELNFEGERLLAANAIAAVPARAATRARPATVLRTE